jgi:hypothetical protein
MGQEHGQKHGQEHGKLDHHAQHWAHTAHHLHLTAEALEGMAHLGEHAKHASAAAKLLKATSQMAYDLRRMRRGIQAIENAAKQGGRVGAKARLALQEARAAYAAAEAAYEREKDAVRAANALLREAKAVEASLRGRGLQQLSYAAKLRLGQAALKLETALSTSRVGGMLLKVGRITSSKPFVRGLVVVGAALEGLSSYLDSTAQTTGGKVVNTALGAGSGALVMANPVVAAVDALVLPKGYKVSELYHGGAGAVTALGEGLLTGDTRAMDEFHKRSMEGHYGKIMQLSSRAGEYWAEKGIIGGLSEFYHAVKWWGTVEAEAPKIELKTTETFSGPERVIAHEERVALTDSYLISLLQPRYAFNDVARYGARARKLEQVFQSTNMAEAVPLKTRLLLRDPRDKVSTYFHDHLSTPTRTKLLQILQNRMAGKK